MGTLKRFNIKQLADVHDVTHVIETGFGRGASSQYSIHCGMKVLSCEIYKPHFDAAPDWPELQLFNDDSLTFLSHKAVKEVIGSARTLIFLDAHFPGKDFKFEVYDSDKYDEETRLPLIGEMALLQDRADNALIIIDDTRIYLRNAWRALSTDVPGEPSVEREKAFLLALGQFQKTHKITFLQQDTGYAILWPNTWGDFALPKNILAGDVTQDFILQSGVVGTTCMSINRRLLDARFSMRWLRGNGLDIGGGHDSIGVYRALFPLINSVTVFDLPQGDAQDLACVPDDEFDFVYSAHCLEHVRDPFIALPNWLRVVKPGGHLVLTVPDEDMYEQGVWPSTFNDDHKSTFTPFKHESWSPASVNVLELLQSLPGKFSIEKIERLNHSHMPLGVRFDQTRTAFAESGIEIIVRKEA